MIRLVQICALMIFAVMLQFLVTEASDLCHPSRNGAVSFARSESPAKQTIEKSWNDCMGLACGINPDLNNIPAIKSIIRFTSTRRKHWSSDDHFPDTDQSYSLSFRSSDPVHYYIFGLRKIIT
jgi:hypothetical protein